MGYSISVKFNSEQDATKMFNFLNQSNDKIQAYFQKSSSVSDHHLSFNTGNDLSSYAPSEDKNLYVSSHSSLITPLLFQLYIWMACLAGEKDINGNPYVVVDTDKLTIVNIDSLNSEELTKNKNILSKNGLHFKNDLNPSLVLKTLKFLSGETKRFNEFNNFLGELQQDYASYVNTSELKVRPSI